MSDDSHIIEEHRVMAGTADEDQEHAKALDILRVSDTFVLIVKSRRGDTEVAHLFTVANPLFLMAAGNVLARAIMRSIFGPPGDGGES